MGRQVKLFGTPVRIISLVPSQTELLSDLGLKDEIAGITKFCIHPEKIFRTKVRIGGTKKYDFEKIKALKPDLIIGNKEENEEFQVKELMKHYPVWMSDIKTIAHALDMITGIGKIVGKQEKAIELKIKIQDRFRDLKQEIINLNIKPRSVSYFIWKNPYMVAGNDTFINHLLELCGFKNVFKTHSSPTPVRYPQVSIEDIRAATPEIILLSSEPYPFKEKHIAEFKGILPPATIKIIDGELFSWYGSRLLHAPPYFLDLLRNL